MKRRYILNKNEHIFVFYFTNYSELITLLHNFRNNKSLNFTDNDANYILTNIFEQSNSL